MAESEAWVMIPKLDTDKTGCVLDMRPLVLCKDCKKRYSVLCIQEEAGNINNQDDWFCADGVAKDTNVPNKKGR